MDNTGTYTKIPKCNVELHAREAQYASRVMGGKGLFNQAEARFTFVENPKRGKRSKLISATEHATLRRRENGAFSMSFVFEDGRYIAETLISECRTLAKRAKEHLDKEAKNAPKAQDDETAKE